MSMYLSSAVARRGKQGDFLGIGSLIGKAVTAFGKVGGLVPLPGAGIASRVITGIGGAITRTTGGLAGIPNRLPIPAPMRLPLLPGGGAGFFTGGGAAGGGGGGMTKDGRPRRIRRDGRPYKRPSMNFANGRAIKRAARRLEGAEKMFRRVFSIRHGGSPGKVLPKKGRR